MALALFDLDNTLLNGDSDHGWGMFLASVGAVDPIQQKKRQDYFYQQYLDGELDAYEFCKYQFEVLSNTPTEQLQAWHAQFMAEVIEPMIESGKADLLTKHQQAGDTILIITATNDFVTTPIATRLGVDTLIATTAEFKNGKYTGEVEGVPCFQDGKITRLRQWLKSQDLDEKDALQGSTFYSDSINDLPLLELVDNPVAVTPDDKLRAHAEKLHWPIID